MEVSSAAPGARLSSADVARYHLRQGAWLALGTAFDAAARRVSRAPSPPPSAEAVATIRRRFSALLRRDLENARAGLYPRELLFSPLRPHLAAVPRLLADAPRVLRRKRSRAFKDLPSGVELGRYPAYYRRNFHWQTDGYFSTHSASIYDLGVELLFRGAADVMRRQVIPPLSAARRRGEQIARVVELGAGTGRTLEQLLRTLPDLDATAVEMSPAYAARAREELAATSARVVVGNAESLEMADESVDAVVSVYLFHELPRRARRRVLAEARRVLRPGGLLVVEDSTQLADSPELAAILEAFPRQFHEPYYGDYLRDDLVRQVESAGFALESAETHLVSRVVVARR